MINWYQTWKDDKESVAKPSKRKHGTMCRICKKRVNSLKRHVEDAHGIGMWSRYVLAEQKEQQLAHQRFLELL
jgi:hypothetical protein